MIIFRIIISHKITYLIISHDVARCRAHTACPTCQTIVDGSAARCESKQLKVKLVAHERRMKKNETQQTDPLNMKPIPASIKAKRESSRKSRQKERLLR